MILAYLLGKSERRSKSIFPPIKSSSKCGEPGAKIPLGKGRAASLP
jgi:hypothetical protein